jgi:hypothetical protein
VQRFHAKTQRQPFQSDSVHPEHTSRCAAKADTVEKHQNFLAGEIIFDITISKI